MVERRPALVLAIVASAIGALVGAALASRRRTTTRLAPLPGADRIVAAVAKGSRGRQVRAGIALVPLLLRLVTNPIVQNLLRRAIARQLARRLSR